MKFKIILFGAGGQLGKALKKELSGDFAVSAFTKNELDITDFPAVAKICAEIRPDFVVNCAAFTAVDRAESERALATKINSAAVGNLAEICGNLGAKLIHFSTDYIFDGKPKAQSGESAAAEKTEENTAGFFENDEPSPINFYGESKLAGERAIQKSDCEFGIIRTSWLFGDGANFVRTMLELSKKNAEIKVVSDQIGSPTFTADLAKTTREILEKACSCESGKLFREIFHATNSGATSWADFARKIFEIKKLPTKVVDIPTAEFPTAARRPQNSILRNSKLPAMRRWEDALADFLK